MSEATLKRIEKAIAQLGRRQEEVCERISALEERVANPNAPTRQEVVEFIDKFAAGEALGEELFGIWIGSCRTDCLRGGLRTIQQREGMHSRLLYERLKELGGTPSHEIPDEVREGGLAMMASTDSTDAQKLLTFMGQFPDVDAVLSELTGLASRLDCDQETQSLLRTVEQDERATLAFLGEACALLNP